MITGQRSCVLPPCTPTGKGAHPALPVLPPGERGLTVSDTEMDISS